MKAMIFVELVTRALEIQTEGQLNGLCFDTDRYFNNGTINFEQHELIYHLIDRLGLNF